MQVKSVSRREQVDTKEASLRGGAVESDASHRLLVAARRVESIAGMHFRRSREGNTGEWSDKLVASWKSVMRDVMLHGVDATWYEMLERRDISDMAAVMKCKRCAAVLEREHARVMQQQIASR
eukprot:2965932-Alexandrium_andersonii.AAC.1